MTAGDKERLLDLLANAHSILRSTLEGIDPELRVHTDTGWQIRDIIGHIATWDREAAKSIRAFQAGTEYSIPYLDEVALLFPELKILGGHIGYPWTDEMLALLERDH